MEMFLLQAWIREQLYFSTWRMGTGMQNRWRPDEYVRVPYATTGLNKIPDSVSDEQVPIVGDNLATDFGLREYLVNSAEERTGADIGCRSYGRSWLFALHPRSRIQVTLSSLMRNHRQEEESLFRSITHR